MSVTIRLAKIGKKFSPTYKIVVSTTRNKRTGKYVDILGSFNPNTNPFDLRVDLERLNEWKQKGALITDAVEKIINNTYTFKKYNPKAEKKAAELAAKKASEESSAEA